jgi:hypothetical protein
VQRKPSAGQVPGSGSNLISFGNEALNHGSAEKSGSAKNDRATERHLSRFPRTDFVRQRRLSGKTSANNPPD